MQKCASEVDGTSSSKWNISNKYRFLDVVVGRLTLDNLRHSVNYCETDSAKAREIFLFPLCQFIGFTKLYIFMYINTNVNSRRIL